MSLEALLAIYTGAQTFRFGDGPALWRTLLALVRSRRKRATCMTMAEVAAGEAVPGIGRCDIVLTWGGQPALVTRTMELRLLRFCAMTAEMALMEGEDETFEGWQAGHGEYYRRLGVFDPQMELIWERFEVVDDLGAMNQ